MLDVMRFTGSYTFLTTVVVSCILYGNSHSYAGETDNSEENASSRTPGIEPVLDEIRVVARRSSALGGTGDSGVALIDPQATTVPAENIAQLLQQHSGIALSGQGGLFQTISVRGLSRQRVANFYLDIPILTERRAGTSSSFIDPTMLGNVELMRGPASTFYGSGAMGGVLQFRPAQLLSTQLDLGWGSSGDENLQYLGTGDRKFSAAISHRGARDSQASNGEPLHSGFDQYNGKIALVKGDGKTTVAFDTLISYGKDIGKANSRFPDHSATQYPRERHWLGQLSLDHEERLHASAFFHYQDLTTTVERVAGNTSIGDSESLDLGGSAYLRWGNEYWPVRTGIDYLARRNVTARERSRNKEAILLLNEETLDAEQDQLGFYIDTLKTLDRLSFTGGLRGSYVTQTSSEDGRQSDSDYSGFARGLWSASDNWSLSMELATAVRFPSLSERYFNGTTGRGTVLGNPKLDAEHSLSLEIGINGKLAATQLELRSYYMSIDNFVTRVEVAPDTLSFKNTDEGNIVGIEFDLRQDLSQNSILRIGGHYLEGEDKSGATLQDIAPNKFTAALDRQSLNWSGHLLYEYRFAKRDVAPTEQAVDSAQLLSAKLSWHIDSQTTLSLWGRNLLDDVYWVSTDSLSTRGEERAFGLHLSWRQ
jgi:outer membrane receptor protein involved in Fe transport